MNYKIYNEVNACFIFYLLLEMLHGVAFNLTNAYFTFQPLALIYVEKRMLILRQTSYNKAKVLP